MKRFFIPLLTFWIGFLAAADQNATKAKVHTVKAAPFRIELNLKGILTPARFAEMKIRPEIWTDLTVARDAMAHGSQVAEGDLLVSLKKEKIEQQLMDWELSLEGTALDLAIAQAETRDVEGLTYELGGASEFSRRGESPKLKQNKIKHM